MDLHYNESPAASWLKQSPAASWLMQKIGGSINVAPNERLISTVAGGALVLNSLIRPRPLSLLGGLIGGALLSRGMTGHCPIYSALGKTAVGAHGSDSAPSHFAQQQSESTIQSRSLAPRDTSSMNHVGLGTSGAETTTGAGPSPLSLSGTNPPIKPRAEN